MTKGVVSSDNRIMHTPIALFIFNRPEPTAKVWRAIIAAKPVRLYVIADGPRNFDEELLCRQTREVISGMGGSCDIRTLFAGENMGLRKRFVSGLDWVFAQEERAIIFEDDDVPHPTFFRFCEELLEQYKDDPRVMHISGSYFLQNRVRLPESYYFSKYPHTWGMATWRRAWQAFHAWEDRLEELELDLKIFPTLPERSFWEKCLAEWKANRTDFDWGYQWCLVCMAQKSLCIMPRVNLISNIGFGSDATHTFHSYWYANLPTEPMPFPLRHPVRKAWNSRADEIDGTIFFQASMTTRARVKNFLRGILLGGRGSKKADKKRQDH
jgi:hypothetical protein